MFALYVWALLVFSSCEGQKEEANSLELELETIVKCHMRAGNRIQGLCDSSKYS